MRNIKHKPNKSQGCTDLHYKDRKRWLCRSVDWIGSKVVRQCTGFILQTSPASVKVYQRGSSSYLISPFVEFKDTGDGKASHSPHPDMKGNSFRNLPQPVVQGLPANSKQQTANSKHKTKKERLRVFRLFRNYWAFPRALSTRSNLFLIDYLNFDSFARINRKKATTNIMTIFLTIVQRRNDSFFSCALFRRVVVLAPLVLYFVVLS